jgi:hypothetical protein
MIVCVDAFARGRVSLARRRGVAPGARVGSNEGSLVAKTRRGLITTTTDLPRDDLKK